MSDLNTQNPGNLVNQPTKKRLGRGLGSLLGGDFSDSTLPTLPNPPNPATSATPAVTTQPPAPTLTTQQVASPAEMVTHEQVVTQDNQTSAPLMPLQVNETKESKLNRILHLGAEKLKPNEKQPRRDFDPIKLTELAESIKAHGILQPIVARQLSEGEFEIVAGERRWRAAQQAGLQTVPVILKEINDQKTLELAIIENIQRADLNPLEEAEAYDRLMHDYNLTQAEIAERLGKERSSIANTLRLLGLGAEVKAMLRQNSITMGHAKVLLSVESAADQLEVAEQVRKENLSVRATEKLVAKKRLQSKAKDLLGEDAASEDRDLRLRVVSGLAGEMQKLLGTKVQIDYQDGKGKLTIQFYSDEQLTQVVEKLRQAWEN